MPTSPKILVLDTYFLTKLTKMREDTRLSPAEIHEKMMKHVRGCTKSGKDLKFLLQVDLVLVPVHSHLHWSLLVGDNRFNVFRVYDSYYNSNHLPYSEKLVAMKVFFFFYLPFIFFCWLLLNSIHAPYFSISGAGSF